LNEWRKTHTQQQEECSHHPGAGRIEEKDRGITPPSSQVESFLRLTRISRIDSSIGGSRPNTPSHLHFSPLWAAVGAVRAGRL
jgi:hypothetical protein